MENLAIHKYTEQEYLELERMADTKSEYYNGEIFAMAGAKQIHNLIAANIIGLLWQSLKDKPCQVYPSDLRVKSQKQSFYTYPDITVICGEPIFLDKHLDTVLNPILIFEVLSDSTEKYDRVEKFSFYREIETLDEYILVSSKFKKIEKYKRIPNQGWLFQEFQEGQSLKLESINVLLDLDEIYQKVDWTKV